jgi:hypothetical protein
LRRTHHTVKEKPNPLPIAGTRGRLEGSTYPTTKGLWGKATRNFQGIFWSLSQRQRDSLPSGREGRWCFGRVPRCYHHCWLPSPLKLEWDREETRTGGDATKFQLNYDHHWAAQQSHSYTVQLTQGSRARTGDFLYAIPNSFRIAHATLY